MLRSGQRVSDGRRRTLLPALVLFVFALVVSGMARQGVISPQAHAQYGLAAVDEAVVLPERAGAPRGSDELPCDGVLATGAAALVPDPLAAVAVLPDLPMPQGDILTPRARAPPLVCI